MQAPLQAKNDSNAAKTEVAGTVAQKEVFADNRPEAVAQRKLAEMMNNSPRVLQQWALGDAIHNSTRMVAQRHEMNALFGVTVAPKGAGATPVEALPAQREEKTNNTGLPNQLKSGIESLSGMSMDHVKVHYNSGKPAQLQAHAYAQGSEIHLAAAQERHLPHEAWHVVQQAQGRVRPTLQMKAGPVNDDPSLEEEADIMGQKAAQFLGSHDPRNLVAVEHGSSLDTQRFAGLAMQSVVRRDQRQLQQNIVQRKLAVGDLGYLKLAPVVGLLQADTDIKWDDDWAAAIEELMRMDEVFTFKTTQELEKFLTHVTMPMASVQQPKSSADSVLGRLCFVYAALAAAELTGSLENTAEMEGKLVGKNRYSAGGGAATAFRQMGISPEERTTFKTDDDGGPTGISADARTVKGKIIEALREGKPLAVGVRWKSTRSKYKLGHRQAGQFKAGNHWVYAVAIMGNTLYIRDQQSIHNDQHAVGHVIGRIDTGTWRGASDDGLFNYVLTKIVAGTPPAQVVAAADGDKESEDSDSDD